MIHSSCRLRGIRRAAIAAAICSCLAYSQAPASSCSQPLCVNRSDDDAAAPVPGMLRYAIRNAAEGSVITFDPALSGRSIELDAQTSANHIKVSHSLSIVGPGADLLTISGGKGTRIFFINAATVQIRGLTLANGLAKGGDGGAASGGAGGGGGAAGLGGAIFLNAGSLVLDGVVVRGNRSSGGNGGSGGTRYGAGRGGGGGGFGGSSLRGADGGPGSDLESNGVIEGAGGPGGSGNNSADPGGDGGWGAGGGGGGFALHASGGRGAPGGPSGFAGGVGGAGAFLDSEDGSAIPAGGGYGGSALGGAIFVRSGQLHLGDTLFLDNTATAGLGAAGAPNGIAKGGSLFICTSSFCGPGHDGVAIVFGKTLLKGSSATDAGTDPVCEIKDDPDVCGPIGVTPGGNDTKH